MSEDERQQTSEQREETAEDAERSSVAPTVADEDGVAPAQRQAEARTNDAGQARPVAAASGGGTGGRTALLVGLALLLGGGAGWFARQAHAATLGSSPDGCRTWQEQICSGAGEQALACQEARAAAKFLPPAACAAALDGVPDTLAKIAASRAPCNQVTEKLCAEFGADSPICGMVREKAPMFPPERCEEMLSSYDLVVRELRMLQRGGLPMMSPPASSPPGHEHPSSDPHGHGHDGHSH